jgi:serine/threonine-protein kinase HipA
MERVGKALRQYSTDTLMDQLKYFELTVFCFLTGNNDMHLKNFSLLEKEGHVMSFCPAYDLVPTALINPDDTEELALTLNAKKRKLKYQDFLAAYENSGLSKKVLDDTLELFVYAKPEMLAVLEKSFVSEEYKTNYSALVESRYWQLGLE